MTLAEEDMSESGLQAWWARLACQKRRPSPSACACARWCRAGASAAVALDNERAARHDQDPTA